MNIELTRVGAIWTSIILLFLLVGFFSFTAFPPMQQDVGVAQPQWQLFLAPFHTVLLHLPIGFIMAAVLLELYYLVRPSRALREVQFYISGFLAISAVVVTGLGLFRGSGGGYNPQLLVLHRNAGIAVAVLSIILFLTLSRLLLISSRAWAASYRLLLFSTVGATLVAGHHGGSLTHGEDYLWKHAPKVVKDYLEPEGSNTALPPGELTAGQQVYLTEVKPILERKCQRCHGGAAHMGGYRVDDVRSLFSGGVSGKVAIKPGDPAESSLVRRILLHPDRPQVMPPMGLEAVNPEEAVAIIGWIRDGASVPDTPDTQRRN